MMVHKFRNILTQIAYDVRFLSLRFVSRHGPLAVILSYKTVMFPLFVLPNKTMKCFKEENTYCRYNVQCGLNV